MYNFSSKGHLRLSPVFYTGKYVYHSIYLPTADATHI